MSKKTIHGNMEESNILCITGVHRSGTSLVANWLQKCGLKLDDGKIMPSTFSNPMGHFEDLDFVDFHQKLILKKDYSNSNGWKWHEEINLGLLDKFEAKKLVKIRNKKYNNWSWKDPRSVLFLKQWKKIIPSLKVLFVTRDKNKVLSSLINRSKIEGGTNEISEAEGNELIDGYNNLMNKYYKNNQKYTLFLDIDEILEDNENKFNQINEFLNKQLNYHKIEEIFMPVLFHRNC